MAENKKKPWLKIRTNKTKFTSSQVPLNAAGMIKGTKSDDEIFKKTINNILVTACGFIGLLYRVLFKQNKLYIKCVEVKMKPSFHKC